MTRAFLLLGGALALAACGHEDPYGTLPTGTDEPLEPGPVARLTVDPGPDEWPAWTPDGHLLYTYRSNTGDNDRCVGLLPGTGGQRTTEWCSNYPGNRDTTDLLSPAAVDADGRVAVFVRRQVVGGGRGVVSEALRLGDFDLRPEEARTLLDFPVPGPDGRPIQGMAQLAWAEGRLGFILEERVLRAIPGGAGGYDTLTGGRGVAFVNPDGAGGVLDIVPGTSLATSWAIHPATGQVWFTVIGDSIVYATSPAGGAVTPMLDFGAAGPVRDIAMDGMALYAVVGGGYATLDTENGPTVQDAGGVLYRAPLATLVPEPLTAVDGPFYRRPAPSAGGTHLAAQRTGDVWLLQLGAPIGGGQP